MELALLLLAAAIGMGLFSDLIAFAMGDPSTGQVEEGRIFSWVGERLLRAFERRKSAIANKEDLHHEQHILRMLEVYEKESVADLPEEALEPPVYNPVNWWKLTVCTTCFNVWLSTALFIALMLITKLPPIWWLGVLPFLGFSNLALAISRAMRNPR